jgi:hypothetical protein
MDNVAATASGIALSSSSNVFSVARMAESSAMLANSAVYVFVAATDFSSPVFKSMRKSLSLARSEPGSW